MTKTRTEWSAIDGERKIVEHIWSEILLVMNRKPKKGNEVKDWYKKFKSVETLDLIPGSVSPKSVPWGMRAFGKE